ncbi:alpha/beta fold hydrolase, partial [Gynuella sp.]|uniref:alpha/beta fold hydrolase n=1 Tax=Gynuella sp. TaxID=2969146 RepID=UPI003D14990B
EARQPDGLQPLTFLQSAASSSDVSVWQFLAPVISGGTTVILDQQGDLPTLVNTLQQHRVNVIQTAPVVLQVLLEYLEHLPAAERTLPDLRWLMTIAEACPVGLIRRWFELYPEIPVMNGFGPSEASDDITWEILRQALPEGETSVPIGKPIANMTMYVLDDQLALLPMGVVGELCVSGVGVGPGYWQDPERTAERFVANPYAGEPGVHGDWLYRTGDLGRWRADGRLEFLGRRDNQVKIRGFRIELGEVEAALAGLPGTADVAVIAHPGPSGDHRLAGYVVAQPGVTLTVSQLREGLRQALPDYMIPNTLTLLDAMPLNAADKIDRKRLSLPDVENLVTEYRAPEGEMEQTLAEIWQTLLSVERVGRDDHFFELGGHSLLAVQMIERLRKINIHVSLTTLFGFPVLRELASQCHPSVHDNNAKNQTEIVVLRSADSGTPLFILPESSGEMFYGASIANAISIDIPVYGLTGPDRAAEPLRSIQSIAHRYIKLIQQIQPTGPYQLLGWSMAGTLAYEIAAQLLGCDQEVSFVGVLDTTVEFDQQKAYQDALKDIRSRDDILVQTKDLYEALQDQAPAPGESLQLSDHPTANEYYQFMRTSGLLPEGWDFEYMTEWLKHEQKCIEADVGYEYLPYPITIHLFKAEMDESGHPNNLHPYLGWDRVLPTSQINVINVPGNHQTMLQSPNVELLGENIAKAISKQNEKTNKILTRSAYYPLVTLKEGQVGAPTVLCIPGAGDNVISFSALANDLPSHWNIIGLQPRGMNNLTALAPHTTIESAAEYYASFLDHEWPSGQVFLMGHSFGGWIAFELEKKLRQLGRRIQSLTLVDSQFPAKSIPDFTSVEVFKTLIRIYEYEGKSLNLNIDDLHELHFDGRLNALHGKLKETNILPAKSQVTDLLSVYRTFAANIRTDYCPSTEASSPVNIIISQDTHINEALQWTALAPKTTIIRSSGNHISMLRKENISWISNLFLSPTIHM